MVNFATWILPDRDSQSTTILDLFISSDASICFTVVFLLLGNSGVVVWVSINFSSNSKGDALFHRTAYDYSRADWDGLRDHLRNVPWEDISKLGASATDPEFCEWVQVESDVYIVHCKYQVKPHSSPWFSAASAAAIVHRNHFFDMYQQSKSSASKLKQASNRCKRVLKADKLIYANKIKECHFPEILFLRIFGQLSTVFSTKVNLLYLLYSTELRCCPLLPRKQNCLKIFFVRTLILMTQISLYLLFLLGLIWSCIIFM